MSKNYILDTNILIHSNGEALFSFEENSVYVSQIVIEELDNLKERHENGDTAYAARESIRMLNALQKRGRLLDGVKTKEGGTVYVFFDEALNVSLLPDGWSKTKPDNLLLLSALDLKKKLPGETILVSNDGNVRLKGEVLGLPVEEYKSDRVETNTLYTGRTTIHLADDDFAEFVSADNDAVKADESGTFEKHHFTEGEFCVVKDWQEHSVLGQYNDGAIHTLRHLNDPFFDLTPRNAGQRFLKEALLKPFSDIPLVCGVGPAGTGKTLLSVAAGLELAYNQRQYKQVLLTRANIPLGGKDEALGFLPGTEAEKISPLLRGAQDAIRVLFPDSPVEDILQELTDRDVLSMQAVAYLRGRSIEDTFLILDEAQNCTPSEIFSIITRLGKNSKCVVLGDPEQCDNFRLDRHNNGLVYTVDRMKDSPLCDIVTFTEEECQRSALAKEASLRMKR